MCGTECFTHIPFLPLKFVYFPGCREEVIFSPFLPGLALQFTLVCLCRSNAQVLYTHNLPQEPDATEKTTNEIISAASSSTAGTTSAANGDGAAGIIEPNNITTPPVVAKTPSTSGKGPTVASASPPQWKMGNCIHQ